MVASEKPAEKNGAAPQTAPSAGLFCCPHCGKPLPLVGAGEVIRHPFAQKLQDRSFAITKWWTLFIAVAFVFMLVFCDSGGPIGRGMGWMLMFLPALPGFAIFFFVKCFPRYRVIHCPYCGYEEFRELTEFRIPPPASASQPPRDAPEPPPLPRDLVSQSRPPKQDRYTRTLPPREVREKKGE